MNTDWLKLISKVYSTPKAPVDWKGRAELSEALAAATITVFAGLVLYGATKKKTV